MQWVHTGSVEKGKQIRGRAAACWFFSITSLVVAATACGGGPSALHAPSITPSGAPDRTPLEIEPVAAGAPSGVVGDYAGPGPAAVLTAAMKAEIAGRALRGGEEGGYQARCTLDRFAVRSRVTLTEGSELLLLYADLSCEARRVSDGAVVWRGELRGRTAASAPNVIASDANVTQRLLDRALSDAGREMASDLAVRALGLPGEPTARLFGDETQQRAAAGLDDSPYGPAALMENEASVAGAMRSLGEHDAQARAAAWNVAAMAAGPGDPWAAGDSMKLDGDALVRFVQYKALARLGSAAALSRLAQALAQEGDPLLAEFLRDAAASGGTGMQRNLRR
jgi:hypothetical protein